MPRSTAIEVTGLPPSIKKILDTASEQYKKDTGVSKSIYRRLWIIHIVHLIEQGVTLGEFEYWERVIVDLRKSGVGFVEIQANSEEIKKICLDNKS